MTSSIICDGSIKFQPHYETEVYVSEAAYICIRQTRFSEEESVWLTYDQFRAIVQQADDIAHVWQKIDEQGGE